MLHSTSHCLLGFINDYMLIFASMENESKKYLLNVFGCQMNLSDAQRMRGILNAEGYSETFVEEEADLILFNTCSVRQNAEQRLIGRVEALSSLKRKNPALIIGVGGCVGQNKKSELLQQLPMLDLVFGPNDIETLPSLLKSAAKKPVSGAFRGEGHFDGEMADGIVLERPFSAMVSIIRGCTNFCAYCIVPYVRGPEVSRKKDELLAFIKDLADRGVKEITLLGQNVNVYGKDLGYKEGFVSLLEEIEEISGIKWVRFLTSHPRDFTEEAVKRIAKLSKVGKNFHLPVQAGADRVLRMMNRGYTREKYLKLIEIVKKHIQDVSVTTDIICGFPTETEKEFQETLSLVKQVRYESAFMYYYSPRPGTKAAEMDGHLSDEEKKERLARLIEVQNVISKEESAKQIGKVVEVLVDSKAARGDNHVAGRNLANRTVNFEGNESMVGTFQKVEITEARNWTLSGKLI